MTECADELKAALVEVLGSARVSATYKHALLERLLVTLRREERARAVAIVESAARAQRTEAAARLAREVADPIRGLSGRPVSTVADLPRVDADGRA